MSIRVGQSTPKPGAGGPAILTAVGLGDRSEALIESGVVCVDGVTAGRFGRSIICTWGDPSMTHALTHFLNPQSVAIIGVSPNPSFINAILNNLLRWQYDKPIYPVN